MGKAYRIPSATDRLRKQQIDIRNLQAQSRNRNTPRPVAATAFAGSSASGSTGGGTGNFLPLSGGTLTGNVGFDPDLIFASNGRVDLDTASTTSESSSNILVTGQGTPDDIRFIDGAQRDGQLLLYQGTNQQTQNLLNALAFTITNIVGTGATNIITVTVSSTTGLSNGDQVDVSFTTNFNLQDAVVADLTATTFTYDLGETGSASAETSGTAQTGNIYTNDGETISLDGTLSILGAPRIPLIFDSTISAGGGWRPADSAGGGGSVSFPITPTVNILGTVTTTQDIDLSAVTAHTTSMTLGASISITFSNYPTTGTQIEWELEITQDNTGGRVITWPAEVTNPPTLSTTADLITVVVLRTNDGGTTVRVANTVTSGGSVSTWANFDAISDIDFATFDGIDIDRLLFSQTSGSTVGATETGITSDATGNMAFDVPTSAGYDWDVANVTKLTLSEASSVSTLQVTNVLGAQLELLETTGTTVATILHGTSVTQYTTPTEHEFLIGVSEIANITSTGLSLVATKQLFLDGGTDTYFIETSADKLDAFVGGVQGFELQEIGTEVNAVVGKLSALALAATDGFLNISTTPGAPTGTPTAYTGKVPMVYDTTNDELYVFNSGWNSISPATPSSIVDGNTSFTANGTTDTLTGTFNGDADQVLQFGQATALFESSAVNYFTSYTRNDATGVAGNFIHLCAHKGADDQGTSSTFNYYQTLSSILDPTNGAEDGKWLESIGAKGSEVTAYTLEGSAGLVNTNVLHSFFGSMVIKSNQDGDDAILRLERNDTTIADDDVVGVITFVGEDSANNETTYGSVGVEAADVSNLSEDGRFAVDLLNSGSTLRMIKADALLNEIEFLPSTDLSYTFDTIGFLLADNTNLAVDTDFTPITFQRGTTLLDYAEISPQVKESTDSGRLLIRVRADNASLQDAIEIQGANSNTRSYININSRITSDLGFGLVDETGAASIKISPLSAATELGIVVQDNASFTVGTLGTNAIPATIITNNEITSDSQADGLFGTHEGAMGVVKNSAVTNAKLWVRIDSGWQFVELTDAF